MPIITILLHSKKHETMKTKINARNGVKQFIKKLPTWQNVKCEKGLKRIKFQLIEDWLVVNGCLKEREWSILCTSLWIRIRAITRFRFQWQLLTSGSRSYLSNCPHPNDQIRLDQRNCWRQNSIFIWQFRRRNIP